MAAIFWQGGMSLLLLQHKHCNLTSLVQTTGTKQDLGKLPFCDISAFQQFLLKASLDQMLQN